MAFGRNDGQRAGVGRREVPGRRHGVHRTVVGDRAGDHREAGDGVHRVVDMSAAVARTDDVERDQVGALLGQLLVGEPAARRHVGREDAGALARRGDQRRQSSRPRGLRRSTAIERLPLLRPAQ